MAIATLADYLAAAKQTSRLSKTTGASFGEISSVGMNRYWDMAGSPGAGTLNPGNTTTGVVPTNTTTGAMEIANFSGNGYITKVDYQSAITSGTPRIVIYDLLFSSGQFDVGGGTYTLGSQPSFSSRIPGGTDYKGLQIWAEKGTTTLSGTPVAVVTYTDQDGNTGHSTTITLNSGGTNNGGMYPAPLASGDTGVRTIESVTVTGGVGGSANILIIRPLVTLFAPFVNRPFTVWLDQTGMPEVFPTSCLACATWNSGNGNVLPIHVDIEIASA